MHNTITKEDLKKGLVHIRSAYRLIFEHQKRVLNIIDYIKDQLGLKGDGGNKYFSDPIASKRGDYPHLKIVSGMWAWDFIFSYCFEFYLGHQDYEFEGQNYNYEISIIQVSDTGFWDSDDDFKTELDTKTFQDVKKAESCFVFIFEIKLKEIESYWSSKEKLGVELYEFLGSQEKEKVIDTSENKSFHSRFLMIRRSMSDFLDQKSTDKALEDFKEYITIQTQIKDLFN